MNYNEKQSDVIEIDLLDLGFRIFSKAHYVILCFLIGAVLLNAYAYLTIEPTYESTSRIYVVSSSTDSVVNLSDLNIGTSLTADYQELVLSAPVLNKVIDKLDLKMNYENLKKMITLVNPSDTRILNLTATTTDPELSQKIAETVAEVSVEYLPDTMNTLAPNIAQHAALPDRKAGPSYFRYTAMGGILGAFLYIAFLIAGYLLDDTVHTAEDMEKYFGMVPLTSISKNDHFVDEEETEKKRRGLLRRRLQRRRK